MRTKTSSRPTPSLTVRRDRQEQEARRQRALGMLESGESQSVIAQRLGVTQQAVSKWARAYRAGGKSALASKGKPGRKTGLTDEEVKLVEAALLQGPVKNGYRNDLWTLRRMSAVVAKVTGRKAPSTTRTWNILREMGWSCQRPAKRARQQNAEAVAAFRTQTWQAIKKKPVQRRN
jgi:transposase